MTDSVQNATRELENLATLVKRAKAKQVEPEKKKTKKHGYRKRGAWKKFKVRVTHPVQREIIRSEPPLTTEQMNMLYPPKTGCATWWEADPLGVLSRSVGDLRLLTRPRA